MGRRAVLLDRDGTIIVDRHYLSDPSEVELLPGAAKGLRRLADAGFLLVVVTNQSGIARGLYGEEEFASVQRRLEEVLGAHGVTLAGAYHCPHHPDFTGPCACRKPEPSMFLSAAADLGLDLRASLLVGDRPRDVAAAEELGARGFLVGPDDAEPPPPGVLVAPDLNAVADAVLGTAEAGGE
ncbi:MAG: HAD family hydrolase [Gemmatimonadota bacterium]